MSQELHTDVISFSLQIRIHIFLCLFGKLFLSSIREGQIDWLNRREHYHIRNLIFARFINELWLSPQQQKSNNKIRKNYWYNQISQTWYLIYSPKLLNLLFLRQKYVFLHLHFKGFSDKFHRTTEKIMFAVSIQQKVLLFTKKFF